MLYAVSFLFSFLSGRDSGKLVGAIVMSLVTLVLVFFKCVGSRLGCFYNQFYPLFLDEISFLLIVLSFLISYLSIYSRIGHVKEREAWKYVFLVIFILLLLVFLFSVRGFIRFFVIFEFIMMPIVFIVGIWRSQKERLTANYYFFFYTLLGRVPLMLCVLTSMKGRNSFFMLEKVIGEIGLVSFMGILVVILAFLCKLPFYGLHIWLPKAHVEAPVRGSMILAGLLLKIGRYGIMRCLTFIFVPMVFSKYVFLCLSGVGVIYPMLVCLRQVDLKSFIAYSSVSHISIALAGLFIYNFYRVLGGFVVFLRHGLISPLIFYSVNLVYERINTRIVVRMGRFGRTLKNFFCYFLLIFVANMGYPPFVSFFRELSLYFSLLSWNVCVAALLFVFIFFSGVVIIYFLVKVFKGKEVKMNCIFLSYREVLVYWVRIYILCLLTLLFPAL